jgi:hypothetical protein
MDGDYGTIEAPDVRKHRLHTFLIKDACPHYGCRREREALIEPTLCGAARRSIQAPLSLARRVSLGGVAAGGLP